MPVTVRQHAFSPKITDGYKDQTASTLWYARGSDDLTEIMTEANATIPADYYGLLLKNIAYENRGGNFWDLEAKYEVPDYKESDGLGDEAEPPTPPPDLAAPGPGGGDGIQNDTRLGPEFSADTTGGTVHITQSLSTNIRKAVAGATAQDHKGTIGVEEGKVNGCDIFAPKFEFTITLKTPFLTWGYIKTIKRLTGKVNHQKFLIFEIGEVLYMGGTPNYHSGDGWSITHKFAVANNEEEVEISDDLSFEILDRLDDDAEYAKYGWEYLWVDYLPVEVGSQIVQRPRAVYVEQVYKYDDLALLGFGGPAS